MHNYIIVSHVFIRGRHLPFLVISSLTPFLMDADSRNKRSSFTLIFYIGDIRYEYFVEMGGMRIYKEELYFYPNSRRAFFFEFHHTQMDGAHASRFLDGIQSEINLLSIKEAI